MMLAGIDSIWQGQHSRDQNKNKQIVENDTFNRPVALLFWKDSFNGLALSLDFLTSGDDTVFPVVSTALAAAITSL